MLHVWDSNSLLCFLVEKIAEIFFLFTKAGKCSNRITKQSIGSLFYNSRKYNKLLGNLAHTFSFSSWKLHSLFSELACTVWNSESRLMNRERFFPSFCSEFQRSHSNCWCHFRSSLPASFLNYTVFGLGFWTPEHAIEVWSSLQETMNGWGQSDAEESLPFFTLSDLWDSFKECSAYGTAVPLALNSCSDGVVQYYVPYLSAIQLYGGFRRHIGPLR